MRVSFRCEDNREAFLAVMSVVVAADHVGSDKEHDYLFDHVCNMDLFDGLDRDGFKALFNDVTARVFDELPCDEGGALTPAGIDKLMAEVRRVLDSWLRSALIQVAIGLSASDKTSPEESALLGHIRRKLA
jgi:hypothetical protein